MLPQNQNGIKVCSKINIASCIIFVICCLLYVTYVCLIENEQNGEKQSNPIRDDFNWSGNEDNIQSFAVARSILTYTQRDIFESPKIEFLPRFKSAYFYEWTSSGNQLRCMPKLIQAGYTKSGTTDMNLHIIQHPYIVQGRIQEVYFWDNKKHNSNRTLSWYTDLYKFGSALIEECCIDSNATTFNLPQIKDKGSKRWTKFNKDPDHVCNMLRQSMASEGVCHITMTDSTPCTAWLDHWWTEESANKGYDVPKVLTADKIRRVIPDAKIVFIMREPVSRLWSDYKFHHQHTGRSITADEFHDLVVISVNWWNDCVKISPLVRCLYGAIYPEFNNSNALAGDKWKTTAMPRLRIGLYSLHIKQWLKAFPREQLVFIRLEDWGRNRTRILNERVFPLLGLPPVSGERITKGKARNQNPHGVNVTMHESTKQLLMDFYRPFKEDLAKMLGDTAYLWADN